MRKLSMFLAMGILVCAISGCGSSAEESAYVQSVSAVCGMGAVGMTNTFAGVAE